MDIKYNIIFILMIILITTGNTLAEDYISDDFERSTLGINWSPASGLTIVGNSDLGILSSGTPITYWVPNQFSADQFSEITLSVNKPSGPLVQVFVRRRALDNARYGFHYNLRNNRWEIFFDGVSGPQTRLLASNSLASQPLPGDTIRIEIIGSRIKGLYKCFNCSEFEELISATDTNPSAITSGQPGIVIFKSLLPTNTIYPVPIIENWNGGSIISTLDTTPPTVLIETPSDGSNVSGIISIFANASDNIGIAGVQFKLDGINFGLEDASSPYSINWNTTSFTDGNHIITAVARDTSNNLATSQININVDNSIPANDIRIPLNDLGTGTYKGFQGGLYENGLNIVPQDHNAEGIARSKLIQPLDVNGNLNSTGKIVLMSIGMSNTAQEWCNPPNPLIIGCSSWTFMGQTTTNPNVNNETLKIVMGARGGQTVLDWDQAFGLDPDVGSLAPNGWTNNYDRIKEAFLESQGLSEAQVQVLWVKLVHKEPNVSLPDLNSDAYEYEKSLADVIRATSLRYPNLKIIFLTTRNYAGYATINLSREPYSYENGFSVKWLIQAQIEQMRNNGTVVDSIAGNLNYDDKTAPWIAWGPYLWADGTNPRSDGLTWSKNEFESDGIHPSTAGETKIGTMLLNFFLDSPYTNSWFRKQLVNDTTPPTVLIETPSDGSNVSGIISIFANASDNIGIAGVQFKLDGINFGLEDASSPYSINWNTTSFTDGNHIITAVARDTSNNLATSQININVDNSIPANDILLSYDFNEGTGQITSDSSGSYLNGVLGLTTATESKDPSWMTEQSETWLNFDGIDDVVTVPGISVFDGPSRTEMTFSARVNLKTIAHNKPILGKRFSFMLITKNETSASNAFQFIVGNGQCNIKAPNAAVIGSWHTITATFKGSTNCILYLDGVEIGRDVTDIPNYIPQSSNPFYIGYDSGSAYINSSIDNVIVYTKALMPSEVSSMYNLGLL